MSNFLFIAAAIVFIIWGISQAQTVLVAVLVSVFLAVLATPPLLWFERKGMPIVVAVALVIVTMIFFLFLIAVVVGTSINSFYEALPQYQQQTQAQIAGFKVFLASHNIANPQKILLQYLNPAAIMEMSASMLKRLGSVFSNIVLIILSVTFILLEVTSFPVKLRTVIGDPQQLFPKFTTFVNDMKRYMVIKTLLSLATGTLVTIWLTILQIDFPILWGFLAFLLNYVPTLGSSFASVPAILLALIQRGIWMAVFVAAGYMVINFVLDYGIEKRLMGRKLGLSTLVVFLSLIFWGSLLGPVGAVLCIPLTMTIKFALEIRESTQWIAFLLGPENLPGTHTHTLKSGLSSRFRKKLKHK